MFSIFQGTIISPSPKRNWKQFLCKILWGKQIALWGTWKSQIRHFHVVVVQWWQRNVPKTVLHLQSFCFAKRINPWWQTNLGWIVCTISYNNNNSSFEAVYNIGSVWGRQSTFFKESLVVRDVYTVSYLATWEPLHWTKESRNIMVRIKSLEILQYCVWVEILNNETLVVQLQCRIILKEFRVCEKNQRQRNETKQKKTKNKNDLKFRRNTFLLFIPESAQKAQFNEIARAIHNFSSDKTFQWKRIWPLRWRIDSVRSSNSQ